MRVDVLTREYPPAVYGGAGVHVAELVRVLRALGLEVHAFDPAAEQGLAPGLVHLVRPDGFVAAAVPAHRAVADLPAALPDRWPLPGDRAAAPVTADRTPTRAGAAGAAPRS